MKDPLLEKVVEEVLERVRVSSNTGGGQPPPPQKTN